MTHIGSPSGIWLGQAQDSASQSVSSILTLATTRGGLGWFVNSQPGGLQGNSLTLSALPTVPSRILVAGSPVSRTSGGDVRSIFVRYQATADSTDASTAATYATVQVVNSGHGGREQFLDLSDAGVMTSSAAIAVANQILKIYQRTSFAGPFSVQPGSLLNAGGQPVDPGAEQAGFVCKLILADFAYGGDILPVTLRFPRHG